MTRLPVPALDALRGWGVDVATLAPLAGDASTRRYWRARGDRGTVVLMECGEPIPAAAVPEPYPFLRWQEEYAALGIRVPGVLGVARPEGLIVLEDLGDELLQHRVEALGAHGCEAAYARAVQWLSVLSGDGTRRFRPDEAGTDDPLTPARLSLELDLYLVQASGAAVDPPSAGAPLARASRALDGATGSLAEARTLLHELCAEVHESSHGAGMVLCHRDYHARNLLLLTDGEVAVIDFQDTRRGPRAYDVASLVHDPYVTLPPALARELIDASRPDGVSADDWSLEVALAAGQRLLKAAGTYSYMSRERGRTEYARWLAPALSRAHEQLASWPPRDALWQALREAGAVGGGAT